MFGIFFTNDLLISDIKMPSDNAPIVWRGDPDLPGVEIRELSVNIPKCTTVLAEEHNEEEQSIIDYNSKGERNTLKMNSLLCLQRKTLKMNSLLLTLLWSQLT